MITEDQLTSMDTLTKVAEYLKVMAHPVRLRIVDALIHGELAVFEVAEISGVSQPQACEHLRLMKRQGLLDSTRRGKAVYYRISSESLPKLLEFVAIHYPDIRRA